jgi:hypothetical protein
MYTLVILFTQVEHAVVTLEKNPLGGGHGESSVACPFIEKANTTTNNMIILLINL